MRQAMLRKAHRSVEAYCTDSSIFYGSLLPRKTFGDAIKRHKEFLAPGRWRIATQDVCTCTLPHRPPECLVSDQPFKRLIPFCRRGGQEARLARLNGGCIGPPAACDSGYADRCGFEIFQ